MPIELSNADLLSRMRNFEDQFVERKTSGDLKDCLKTIVAFANSAPAGLPAVLYVGVRDSGEIETPQVNLDTLQRTLNREIQKTYPRVTCLPKIIENDGRQALAVIVYGSENRPHFSGPSYIRAGSETLEASEGQFNELIAARNSKVAKLLASKGKPVTVVNGQSNSVWSSGTTLYDCDQFWITLEGGGTASHNRQSFPLRQVEISFDNVNERLKIVIDR